MKASFSNVKEKLELAKKAWIRFTHWFRFGIAPPETQKLGDRVNKIFTDLDKIIAKTSLEHDDFKNIDHIVSELLDVGQNHYGDREVVLCNLFNAIGEFSQDVRKELGLPEDALITPYPVIISPLQSSSSTGDTADILSRLASEHGLTITISKTSENSLTATISKPAEVPATSSASVEKPKEEAPTHPTKPILDLEDESWVLVSPSSSRSP